MSPPVRDPFALDGKLPAPESRFEVVVVGAGPAGIAAAITAARGGARVLLVDENPVSAATMGLDVPLFFGGRMTGAVQNRDRMLEQVFNASPGLAEAFELGVDVALGTCAWGVFVRGYGLQALPDCLIGLADEDRAWMVGFDRLILATGARDLALGFPGWDQPGVMGAVALHSLLTRYNAFGGRRIVILGSDRLALETALMALDRGLEIAALVEVRDRVQGPADLAEAVLASGVEILTGHVAQRAEGGADGVERVRIAAVIDPRDAGRVIDCDTVCLAVGRVPAVELLGAAGASLSPRSTLGGYTPTFAGAAVDGLSEVFVAGDAAGLGLDEVGAEAAGRHAATAALAALAKAEAPSASPPNPGVGDAYAYQADWVRALAAAGDNAVHICQCEEVSRAALLAVRQPAYLGPPSNGMVRRDLGTLAADGPVDTDQIKRLTRAGMGVCQGRRCREQVALTLALAANTPLADIPLTSYRAPVRPLPLKVLAAWDETAAMAQGWDVWFGIPSQWIPYADIGTEREAEALGRTGHL
jgi:thioredoxin reductase